MAYEHGTMTDNGCGSIAVANTMISLNGEVSPEKMANIISYLEVRGAVLG